MDTVKLNASMPESGKCPNCGTPMPGGALGGLCPACLLKQGVADTAPEAPQTGFQPPSIAELAPLFPELELLDLIGRGGMGAVYQARQKNLDRFVALKILPPVVARDAAFAERFAREARALAKLNHPGIVVVHEFGKVQLTASPTVGAATGGAATADLYFFLMEFVDGVTLRHLITGERISPREALAIVPQICDALQFAHDQGIVHRDIKPENILIDRRGRVKVADFGLAKIIESATGSTPVGGSASKAVAPGHKGTKELTEAGKVMGTPNYIAPEQIAHPAEVDHRADIYALGVVLYQMLTGELPGKELEPPSHKVQVDVRLDEVVLRALEKDPDRRYQHASEVRTSIETILSEAGPDRSRSVAAAAGATSSPCQRSVTQRILSWTARIMGTLLLALFVTIAIGEGLPPVWKQPEGVRVEFLAMLLMVVGFVVGWRWEGWAALSLLTGSALFHVVEWKLLLGGALEFPTIVGVLYAFSWLLRSAETDSLAGKGRHKTTLVVVTISVIILILGGGLWSHFQRSGDRAPAVGAPLPKPEPAAQPEFLPPVEAVLKSPSSRTAELLDLDTGQRATSLVFGENDRETHAWVRANRLDVLGVIEHGHAGVLGMDMLVLPLSSNGWDTVSAAWISTNANLQTLEPDKITALIPITAKTDTWAFRTREDGLGVFQVLGTNANPFGVKVRYKLLRPVKTSRGLETLSVADRARRCPLQ